MSRDEGRACRRYARRASQWRGGSGAARALAETPIDAVERADATRGSPTSLEITRPDDWHLHLRDGALLERVVGATTATQHVHLRPQSFGRFSP